MRTSTLLAVLAALMLLVACAAPVFGQSSSSSTGESSSSSAATIIASSSSSTGTSGNNNTVASSSAASASSSSSGANGNFVTVTVTYPFAANATYQQQLIQSTVSEIQFLAQQASSAADAQFVSSAPTSTSFTVLVRVYNAASFLGLTLDTGKIIYPQGLGLATITTDQQNPSGGAASTLSIGFAAVALVFAALLQ